MDLRIDPNVPALTLQADPCSPHGHLSYDPTRCGRCGAIIDGMVHVCNSAPPSGFIIEEPNAGVSWDGHCMRCGQRVSSTGGCSCQWNASPSWPGRRDDSTWPKVRALVAQGRAVPAGWVRELLEDYDRLRNGG